MVQFWNDVTYTAIHKGDWALENTIYVGTAPALGPLYYGWCSNNGRTRTLRGWTHELYTAYIAGVDKSSPYWIPESSMPELQPGYKPPVWSLDFGKLAQKIFNLRIGQ
jgi:hypothetical protein